MYTLFRYLKANLITTVPKAWMLQFENLTILQVFCGFSKFSLKWDVWIKCSFASKLLFQGGWKYCLIIWIIKSLDKSYCKISTIFWFHSPHLKRKTDIPSRTRHQLPKKKRELWFLLPTAVLIYFTINTLIFVSLSSFYQVT